MICGSNITEKNDLPNTESFMEIAILFVESFHPFLIDCLCKFRKLNLDNYDE
jgi:hypothetical protein